MFNDIEDAVGSYVECNDHEKGNKNFPYKNYPGPYWMHNFLKCNNLCRKQANKLSVMHHKITRSPFIKYNFYQSVAKVLDDLEIGDRPELIWNANETGLPHEPKKYNVVSQKGQKNIANNYRR